MEQEQQFKCSGNCLNCLPAQRAYCASQHAYSNMKVLDRMMEELAGMREVIMGLAVKIEAIQNSEAAVFDPTESLATNPQGTVGETPAGKPLGTVAAG